jgi:hypothetical protein
MTGRNVEFPPGLRALIEDETILKMGVDIKNSTYHSFFRHHLC